MTTRRRLPVAAAVSSVTKADATDSGLPWLSGSTAGGGCLAGLRGRPLDVLVNFLTHAGFQAMVNQTAQPLFQQTAGAASLWVVSVPLLDDRHPGQFAQCAGSGGVGAFDGYWQQIGANLGAALRTAGRSTVIILSAGRRTSATPTPGPSRARTRSPSTRPAGVRPRPSSRRVPRRPPPAPRSGSSGRTPRRRATPRST